MKIHSLKLNHEFYQDSEDGTKSFEIRKNDRDYKVGDLLVLREYKNEEYTGRFHFKEITYILESVYTLNNYIIMSVVSLPYDVKTAVEFICGIEGRTRGY